MKKVTHWWGWRNDTIYCDPAHSIPIKGDRTASRARWWNHLWLVSRGWTKVAIFEVDQAVADLGYYVAFEPQSEKTDPRTGKTKFYNKQLRLRRFGMLVGDGDCLFWIENRRRMNRSLPLRLVGFTDRHNAGEYVNIPLL